MRFLLSSVFAAPIVFLSFLAMAALANSGGLSISNTFFCFRELPLPTYSLPIGETKCWDCDGYWKRRLPEYKSNKEAPQIDHLMAAPVEIVSLKYTDLIDIENEVSILCRDKNTTCQHSVNTSLL